MINISLHITNRCNFNCNYCISNSVPASNRTYKERSYDEIVDAINRHFPEECHISIDGSGEPFLYKDFHLLCKKLTKKHNISIITNLSQPIDDFMANTCIHDVEAIYASLHYEERIRKSSDSVEEYVDRCITLLEEGYVVIPTFVYDPYGLDPSICMHHLHNIQLLPQRLKVNNESVQYSEGQKNFLKEEFDRFLPYSKYITDCFFDGPPSFKGNECSMGYQNFIIDQKGNVFDCTHMNSSIGNIFRDDVTRHTKKQECHNLICLCAEKNGIAWT